MELDILMVLFSPRDIVIEAISALLGRLLDSSKVIFS